MGNVPRIAGRVDGRLYNSQAWRNRRREQLQAEPLCRMCRQIGRVVPATVADHIVPHRGDVDLFWNGELQSLCASCHSGAKQSHEAGKLMRGCDVSGNPLDPDSHWYAGEGG